MVRHVAALALLLCSSACALKKPSPLPEPTGIPGNWRLVSNPAITLTYQQSQFRGYAGCNQYFATVKREARGLIKVDPVGATRMACPEPAMTDENQFFMRLQAATTMRATTGQLTLAYRIDGRDGTLVFEPER